MCRGQDAMDSGHRQRCRGRRNIPTGGGLERDPACIRL